jgi:hypothetical protein
LQDVLGVETMVLIDVVLRLVDFSARFAGEAAFGGFLVVDPDLSIPTPRATASETDVP